ncbi:MAG: maltose alpha-D-glucosyltransferase [Sterolibacteriaceae bacterium]|uniref:Maltokinase n=1 Tax=Candidatus Methylophosphatis roskildensis TaxID=2899263 RepID=A0A9D7E1M0_9PROT|nr:maltose alpha-D-glucosyltransferase [Candidatus Methylophosphatis roskildensis]MBK7235987.1 maltose alpha-D-glucosyltransferase [Sterolibacteriaceae bacterium]
MRNNALSTLNADPLWYKDAIIYQLNVKAFLDSNGDGIGDFSGLTEKLDYVQDLGVNTLWLLPFYPSPMRDDGYDIADYRNVAKEYGTLADFRGLIREAHQRGLRVITELVINHTSDEHPWFQAARRAPAGSNKRDYYVWSDSDKKWPETRIIFTDTEKSNWAWDEVAGAYYWHRFFSHQPDLNFNNPQVVKAVIRTMRYWFDMGVDGLRLDAIPYLCERDGTSNENLPETHAVIQQMRAVVDAHYPDRLFLAEANQWPEDVREYFGNGDECHMAYHFPLMPRMYMALAQEDRYPIVEILRQTPEIPANCQWAIFLRNHDELTLEMVTHRERDYMYNMYAADPRTRINVGIRRRLAPLLDNNRAKIQLMTALILTMPGSPILYYGDEIGMGDNIYLGDRNGVRTPMQWTPDRNAGFSRADPQKLYLPPIMDPIYGYQAVNVEAQSRNPSSLLNWVKRLIATRKSHTAFGRGDCELLNPGNRKVLAYLRSHGEESILCVANLSHSPQPVELDLSHKRGRVPVELSAQTPFPPIGDLPYLLTLPAYGFYSFRLAADAEVPSWHEDRLPRAALPVLVLVEGWQAMGRMKGDANQVRRLIASRTHDQLQKDVLAPYIESKRWYAAKGRPIESIDLQTEGEWLTPYGSWLLTLLSVKPEGEAPQLYSLPLGLAWERGGEDQKLLALGAWTLAKVRQREREGILYGALGDGDFCHALLAAIGENAELEFGGGKLKFRSTSAFARLTEGVMEEPVLHPSLEQSNTSVLFGNKLFLKAYRRVHEGMNPELEMGQFLTETSPFPHIVPVAGGVHYERNDGTVLSLALLQGFVENQGDAWRYTLDYVERFLSPTAGDSLPISPEEALNRHAHYDALIETLGRRVGEMHKALAATTGDPVFDPEPVSAEDLKAWTEAVRQDLTSTLWLLRDRLHSLPESLHETTQRLLDCKGRLLREIHAISDFQPTFAKTRYHGDLHLGQVLLVQNDFIIIDFEGEPARPVAERRTKSTPLRDVAGMLRSFNYAAHATLKKLTVERPGDRELLEPLASAWERGARKAFMAGYRNGIDGAASWPEQYGRALGLIALFSLEKALYEVRYELNNRPAWIDIPIGGLLELATGDMNASA